MMKNSKIQNYSLAMLLTLYLAQGLPTGFMTQALPALLRHYGVSLTQISISGLLMMPWAIKFLWAPYVDRYGSSRFGHYRSWILLTQTLTIFCLILLAFLPINQLGEISTLWGMFIVLFVMNTLCATQDIATDGLAVNILKNGAVQWGNTFQVIGSRLGFILGGGAVLYFIDLLSWKTTFLLLAVGVMLNSLLIFFYREPDFGRKPHLQKPLQKKPKYSILQRLKKVYGHLWASKELKVWLCVVFSYKLADGISGPILKPMMIDTGLSLSQIGVYVTIFGAMCAVVGALLAGWLIKLFSLKTMFLVFSFLQILSFVYYIILAEMFQRKVIFADHHFYIANALEELFAAMSLVAMLSLIMQHCRQQFAATDFTLQVALMSIIGGVLYMFGGIFADYVGYALVLYLSLFIAFGSFLIRMYWANMKKIY